MIVDSKNIPDGAVLRADLCIVGAGAAGISVALGLADSGSHVLMVESGGFSTNKSTGDFDKGEAASGSRHPPLHEYRRRVIGGTSTVWGGRCQPFDSITFEPRSYFSDLAWPISCEELLPYYRRANLVCEAGRFDYTVRGSLGHAGASLAPGFRDSAVRTDSIERYSCPTNFGHRYLDRLRFGTRLTLVHSATCTAIRLHPDARHVDALVFRTLDGKTFQIAATRVVLALGCLETTRLLLASNDVMPQGIGNHSDLLGRFYMSHIEARFSKLRLSASSPLIFGYERTEDGIYCRRTITISADRQRRDGIGTMVARLQRPSIADPSHGSGVLSAAFLTKSVLFSASSVLSVFEHRKRSTLTGAEYMRHVTNVFAGLPKLVTFAPSWLCRRTLAQRKLPSVLVPVERTCALEIWTEQQPNRDSRVSLTRERDSLGLPRLRVDWRMADFDVRTMRRSVQIVQAELRRTGSGDLQLDDRELTEQLMSCTPVGGHQIGTARMATAPSRGVVDDRCRVHGIDNLFVSGPAVFPTGGQAGPMLTTVALALRLADHLKTGLA